MFLIKKSAIINTIVAILSLSCNSVITYALPANCHPLKSNTIYSPGCYFLNKNIKGAITIDSDSVVLDLNENKISDPNPGSHNIGIKLGSHSNVIIKNGHLDGFWFAISGSGGRNLNVLNISFINTKNVAINLSGSKINVRGNYIGNMDFFQPKDEVNYYLVGMNIRDTSGCRILNNVMSAPRLPTEGLEYRLEYVGLILLSSSQNCRIQNNIFSNFKSPLFKSIAVWLASGTASSFLRDNLILNYQYGITGTLDNYSEENNLLINVETPKLNKAVPLPSFLNDDGVL